MTTSHAEALRLIERAVDGMQGRYHPGKPMFYALERVRSELGHARREAESRGVPIEHTTDCSRPE